MLQSLRMLCQPVRNLRLRHHVTPESRHLARLTGHSAIIVPTLAAAAAAAAAAEAIYDPIR
jgi:hypothetical protein